MGQNSLSWSEFTVIDPNSLPRTKFTGLGINSLSLVQIHYPGLISLSFFIPLLESNPTHAYQSFSIYNTGQQV